MFIASAVSARDPSLIGVAVATGFFTWVLLNRHTARGDFAALFYIITFSILFFVAWQSGTTLESPLVFSTTLAAIYGFSALLSTVAYRLSPFHPLASYPGPRLWWSSSLIFSYVTFKGRRHLILDELHAKYGPFIRIGPNTMSINSPAANEIYSASHYMEKSESYAIPGHLDANALFFKQKSRDAHDIRKRIWSKAFSSSGVTDFFPPLERRTWQLLKCIETRSGKKGGIVDLAECFAHWSYDFMGEMVFGGSNHLELMRNGDPENMVEGGKIATVILDSVGQSPWLMDMIWHLPAGKDLHRVREIAAEMMRTRIKADADVNMRDLSSYLLGGDSQTGEKISLQDLELDAVVAIQGGSDNTTMTMSLAFYFLISQPSYYQTLRAELDRVFPDPTGALPPDKLLNLPFLNGVIHESLRLSTPFFLPRVVPDGGASIDGRFIPAGTVVAAAAYSQQTSPSNFYPEPLEFRPERWSSGGLGPETKAEKSALASFSYGPHVCVARNFAYQEMRYVIGRLVLSFDMKFPDDFDVRGFREGVLNMRTLMLEKPLRVRVTRRPGVDLDSSY